MALDGRHERAAVATSSMIEQLPADVMVRVMKFVKIPDRIKFSSCSKALQKLVCKECVPLWTSIDFSVLERPVRLGLTDKMLSSLLTRVNAWSVTRTLNIALCNNLTGTFLDSLICSRTLEKLYLQQDYADGGPSLDESIAVSFLRSMLPFKLSLVRFDWELPDQPCVAANFLRELSEGQLRKAKDQNLKCSACDQAVVDESRQTVVAITGTPSKVCGECKHQFCREASCPIGLLQCRNCGDTFCDVCEKQERCDTCLYSYCKGCCTVEQCASCSDRICSYCRGDSDATDCAGCEKMFCCGNCLDTRIEFCNECEESFCMDCRQMNNCDMCDTQLCEGCTQVKQCSICSNRFCLDCRKVYLLDCCDEWVCLGCVPMKQCDGCNKTFCASERVEECDQCNKSFCETCVEVRDCGHCSKSFCVLCRDLAFFDGSGETFCLDCKTPEWCGGCSKMFCKGEIEWCGACRKSFCDKCREMEHCESCFKSFCNDDCAFVDRCGQCETRYCEGCALVVRCPWCGEASCEKCRQNGGFCPMCNEKPRKKARM